MTYFKKQFAEELKAQLSLGYDVKRISRWAFKVYFEYCDRLESGLRDIVMEIIAMEEGSEFEIPKDELLKLAKDLETS